MTLSVTTPKQREDAPEGRVEDRRLLTGKGRFVDDLKLEGQAYMGLVRSPYAHAKINSIDFSKARSSPDFIASLTGRGPAQGGGAAALAEPLALPEAGEALPPGRRQGEVRGRTGGGHPRQEQELDRRPDRAGRGGLRVAAGRHDDRGVEAGQGDNLRRLGRQRLADQRGKEGRRGESDRVGGLRHPREGGHSQAGGRAHRAPRGLGRVRQRAATSTRSGRRSRPCTGPETSWPRSSRCPRRSSTSESWTWEEGSGARGRNPIQRRRSRAYSQEGPGSP